MPKPSLPKPDELSAMIDACKKQGLTITGFQTWPDGTIEVRTAEPEVSGAGESLTDQFLKRKSEGKHGPS